MKESLLNVKMYSTQNCQEIIDEICDEYPNGRTLLCGVRVWIARKKEEFLKQVNDNLSEFDHISHALTIGERHTNYHLIQKGTRFGIYSGLENVIIIHPKYLQIVPMNQDRYNIFFAALDENYKWGVLKENPLKYNDPLFDPFIVIEEDPLEHKIELVPFKFDDVRIPYSCNYNFNHIDYFPVKNDGKWGVYDSQKKELNLPIEFDDLKSPVNGFYPVKNSGKWGIYDSHKKELNLPIEFDDLKSPVNGFYPVKNNGKWGLYYPNENDMVIAPIYDDANILSEGLWAVKKDGKWGFVDVSNNIVVPFEYEWVSNYILGYAHASKSKRVDYSDILFDDEILLDHQGRRVYFMNPEYYDDNNRYGFEVKTEGRKNYYVVDKKGNIVIPQNKYRYLGEYSEGLFAASLDGKTLGYIDIEENVIIPFEYEIGDEHWGLLVPDYGFHWGIACVNSRYKYFFINQKNEAIFLYYSYPYGFCSFLEFNYGKFKSRNGFNLKIIDIINYNKGKDMSYLIEIEKQAEQKYLKELNGEEPYEWTAEDAWDAMTDGMYGDYPGGDIDYEKIGF